MNLHYCNENIISLLGNRNPLSFFRFANFIKTHIHMFDPEGKVYNYKCLLYNRNGVSFFVKFEETQKL